MIATVPAAAIGAIAEDPIEEDLGQPWQIAILLVVFAMLLWLADRLPERREVEQLGWRAALAVGFAQAVALAPGTSRSGITITAGRALGLTRAAAARFSFLLLAPITFGAILFEGVDALVTGLPAGALGPFVVGIAGRGRLRLRRDLGHAALPADPQLRHLRLLPPDRRGGDRRADRDGRAVRGLSSSAGHLSLSGHPL